MARFLLFHSPLVGPGSMTPTAKALREMGHEAAVPETYRRGEALPSWHDWPNLLAAACGKTQDALLVGHSMAGLLARALADRLKASATIYLDANIAPEAGPVPPADNDFLTFVKGLAREDGTLPPWQHWWGTDLYQALGFTPDQKEAMEAETPSLPLSWFDGHFGMPEWSGKHYAYCQCSDRFAAEADRAEAKGWPVQRLSGSHLHPMLRPLETAKALAQLAADLSAR